MPKRYIVDLTEPERTQLRELTKRGTVSARKLTRAHILLQAAEGAIDTRIAETLHVSISTVERIRRRFVEEGLASALTERPRPGGQPKLDGTQEAHLVALACSQPPTGREQWTMQLLADRLVALGVVASISDETVRRTLKKGSLNPG
jgi:transposase